MATTATNPTQTATATETESDAPAAEVEVDQDTLLRTVAEYGAALTALLGDDFEAVLDARLVTMRDGTVKFVTDEPSAAADADSESASGGEAAAGSSEQSEAAPAPGDPTAATTATAAASGSVTRLPVGKLPAAFAARNAAPERPAVTDKLIAEMSPGDFLKDRKRIYDAVAS